jgi:hypothetical protein
VALELADAEDVDERAIAKIRERTSHLLGTAIQMRGDLLVRKRPMLLEKCEDRQVQRGRSLPTQATGVPRNVTRLARLFRDKCSRVLRLDRVDCLVAQLAERRDVLVQRRVAAARELGHGPIDRIDDEPGVRHLMVVHGRVTAIGAIRVPRVEADDEFRAARRSY